MSKRRRRQPNLPQETLARARREAGLEAEPAQAAPSRPARTRRSEEVRPATPRRFRSLRSTEELTQDEIAERLANPVRQVSEAQLRAQYGYVIVDLRSMGLLALALFVLMILGGAAALGNLQQEVCSVCTGQGLWCLLR